jgi:ribosomal protein S18
VLSYADQFRNHQEDGGTRADWPFTRVDLAVQIAGRQCLK